MLARDVDAAPRLRWMVGGLAVGATILVLIFHSFDPSRIVAASQNSLTGERAAQATEAA